MKNLLITCSILTALLSAPFAYADTAEPKQWNIGVSSYALVISADDYGDDDFGGLAISADYAISDSFAIRGTYYSLEHENLSELDVSGFEILGYYGTGLMSQGFKAFIGGGLYSETLEIANFDEDFSGVQLNGGVGYNWESVAVDLSLGIRSTGDYEDFISDGDDLTATSAALTVSFRF